MIILRHLVLSILLICLCLSQGGTISATKVDSLLGSMGVKLEEKEFKDLIENLQMDGKPVTSLSFLGAEGSPYTHCQPSNRQSTLLWHALPMQLKRRKSVRLQAMCILYMGVLLVCVLCLCTACVPGLPRMLHRGLMKV